MLAFQTKFLLAEISVWMILLNIPDIENGLFRFAKVTEEVR